MTETQLVTFNISKKLLEQLDETVEKKGYANRTVAIHEAIRDFNIKHKEA